MGGRAAEGLSVESNAPGPPAVTVTHPPAPEVAGGPPLTKEDLANGLAQAVLEAQRSLLVLQEQWRSSLAVLETARQHAAAAAHDRTTALSNQLATLEQSLIERRRADLEVIERSNRTLLVGLGMAAAMLVLLVLLTIWMQMRALYRLTDAAFRPHEPLPRTPSPVPALPAPDLAPARLAAPPDAGPRLLNAVAQLEERIRELEHLLAVPLAAPVPDATAHRPSGVPPAPAPTPRPVPLAESAAALAGEDVAVGMLLGQGQSLLNAGLVEQALACFDEVIAREPKHAEALMKKGVALERQEKYKEALDHYDRAIAANRSLTLAYLHKGGVFNQLERFDEALQCYEQALKLQQLAGGTKTE